MNLPSARAGTAFVIRIAPPNFAPVAGYTLSIGLRPIFGTSRRTVKPRHLETTRTPPQADAAGREKTGAFDSSSMQHTGAGRTTSPVRTAIHATERLIRRPTPAIPAGRWVPQQTAPRPLRKRAVEAAGAS